MIRSLVLLATLGVCLAVFGREKPNCDPKVGLVDGSCLRAAPKRPLEELRRTFLRHRSADVRGAALSDLNRQNDPDSHKYNQIALRDPSPKVRSVGAFWLRGTEFVPLLVDVMATDKDPEVRRSAAFNLSSFYTDNGQDMCKDVMALVASLDGLLTALKDEETERPVTDILGARYSGETFLPCCMPKAAKQRVVQALLERPQANNVPEALKNVQGCAP